MANQVRKVFEVWLRFLALGCVSFGGPAAHIGYFQKTFVEKLGWIELDAYARLISLSQFLPGPGSSQIGFAIGLQRAGLAGAVAAFIGFTLPSFVLMYLLAIYSAEQTNELLTGVVHGLKMLAVVVVADATLTLFRAFCKETLAVAITTMTAVMLLAVPGIWTQMGVLLVAGIIGVFFHQSTNTNITISGKVRSVPLIFFIVLFLGLPLFTMLSDWAQLIHAFYQSGSLVFGGGHVVLPLLQQTVGESISTDRFLLGYAAAQAVPGPMFSLATFLGAELAPGQPLLGALLATLAIFLPGFLLVLGLQDAWEGLAQRRKIAGAVWGINAAVVGLLLSALYSPVFISSVRSAMEMALVIVGFFALNRLKVPVVYMVIIFAIAGLILKQIF